MILVQRIGADNFVLMYGRHLLALLQESHGEEYRVLGDLPGPGQLRFADGHEEPCQIMGFAERKKAGGYQKKNYRRR